MYALCSTFSHGLYIICYFVFPIQMYATPGKLVKIVLTNFMCHKHIEVTFHENVNVILGRNGSKSKCI